MFPEPVTFHSSVELIQDLLARVISKLRGMYNHWSNKHTVKKEEFSVKKLIS